MKVIVLAAGRSKRLKPLEDKNFLNFLGKPLIQHQLEQLCSLGLKDFIIIGGAHNLRKLRLLAKNSRFRLKIVEQKNLDAGMAGAILSVKKQAENTDVLIVSAQDVVEIEAYSSILKASRDKKIDSFIVGKKINSWFPGGYLKLNKNGLITDIIEKPAPGREPSKMLNLVIHYHRRSKELYEALEKVKAARDDHYEAALDSLIRRGVKMKMVQYGGFWQAIKYPWHVLTVMDYFLERTPKIFPMGRIGGRPAEIAKTATIRGESVYLEDGVRVLDNAVIVGPAYIGKNTIIATNALVRRAHIGDNCVIGFGTEVARSFLGKDVWTHANYIGDSVIGNDVAFGSGTVTGNLRLDEKNISVFIQNQKIDSGLKKFGLVTGDHVRCGINSSFMPGIKIGNNCFIGAGITVAKDIPDNKYVYGRHDLVIKENNASVNNESRLKLKKKL